MNFNMQMSYTLIEYTQNTRKSNFFALQVSFEMNLNMHMSSTLIEYVLTCIGRNTIHMYDKYIGPIFIQSSYCSWVMAMLLLDWLLSWKLPGLVVPARGIIPTSIVFRVMEEHKPHKHLILFFFCFSF